jgi:signal transduction histidine kinase
LLAIRQVLGLGAGYAGLALLSVLLVKQPGHVAVVWYANALAVIVLVGQPAARWPRLLAMVATVNALVNLATGSPPSMLLAFVPANLLEIALAAKGLKQARLTGAALRSPVALLRVMWLAGLWPQALAATLASALLWALEAGDGVLSWLNWFEGSAIGALSLLPLGLMLSPRPHDSLRSALRDRWLWIMLPLTLAVSLLCLAYTPYPFVLLGVPLLVSAMLLDLVSMALLVMLLSVTVSLCLATGVFLPPPVTAEWQTGLVFLAQAAAMMPALLLASALAEQRDNRAHLMQGKAQLLKANQALQEFVRMASHDLREPLNTIAQFTGLIEQDHARELRGPAHSYLGLVSIAAQRMRLMLDDVVHYSQVQSTQLPAPDAVALDDVLARSLRKLERPLAQCSARCTAQPLPVVLGHAHLLELLLTHLLDNAMKFVPAGQAPSMQVSARLDGERVWLEVQDQGIGIAPEHLARLFKPFQRLNRRQAYEGTGLGLAICSQIASVHGGQIVARSVPGQGSCFSVSLPSWRGPILGESVAVTVARDVGIE